MHVEVYIKTNCSLCDDALEALARRRVPFVTFDIADRADWFQRYRYAVPVLVVDGQPRLTLRWTSQELDCALG